MCGLTGSCHANIVCARAEGLLMLLLYKHEALSCGGVPDALCLRAAGQSLVGQINHCWSACPLPRLICFCVAVRAVPARQGLATGVNVRQPCCMRSICRCNAEHRCLLPAHMRPIGFDSQVCFILAHDKPAALSTVHGPAQPLAVLPRVHSPAAASRSHSEIQFGPASRTAHAPAWQVHHHS